MIFDSLKAPFSDAQTGAADVFRERRLKPSVLDTQNLPVFFKELGQAIRLVMEEKEIIVFAALQWVIIAIAYVLWTAMLDWIPDSVWTEVAARKESDGEGVEFILVNLVLLGWSFAVVAVASYPLSALNSAMIHAHFLRASGRPSTVWACIDLAFRNLGRMWFFTTIDAWITVTAIMDRLPRRGKGRTLAKEALYYAWKIGTIGVLPALAAGRGHIDAAGESLQLLKKAPFRAIAIRMGYSLLCWIVGISSYGGTIWYLSAFGNLDKEPNWVYDFYVLMAIPIVIAVGVVAVLVRPFYLIMVAKLYTDVVQLPPLPEKPETPDQMSLTELIVLGVFVFLFVFLLVMYLLGDHLGVRAWIEGLAMQDMLRQQGTQ